MSAGFSFFLDSVNGRAPSSTTENVQRGAKYWQQLDAHQNHTQQRKRQSGGRNKSKSLIRDQCVNTVEQS